MIVVGVRIDTQARAVRRATNTSQSTPTLNADLTVTAELPAGAAVVAVVVEVDAGALADG